jgi:1-acyl-sn-glycerol-3-phosphate acyltransferase
MRWPTSCSAATTAADPGVTLFLRSLAFNLLFFAWIAALGLPCLPLLALPRRHAWKIVKLWTHGVLLLLRCVAGIRHVVRGAAPPDGAPVIVAAKHQSAWDTLIFLVLFDDPAYVLKRELFKIPVYGWFTWKLHMIGIDRSAGTSALKRLVAAARPMFAARRPVVIFPQGTRTPPGDQAGSRRPYLPGVYMLYADSRLPVVPVALNSGYFWGRRAFLKRPGTIVLEFLPALPSGLDRRAFMAELESRIETATAALEVGGKPPT